MEPMTQEQLELVGRETGHAAGKVLKKYVAGALVAYIVLLGGLFGVVKASQDVLHEGLKGSCYRVNVLRAQSNASDVVSFKILSSSAIREAKLAKMGPASERKTHATSAHSLATEARTLTVTGITNCEQAVNDPEHYVTPVAGPIGEPTTGKLNVGVAKTIKDSHQFLKIERARGGG